MIVIQLYSYTINFTMLTNAMKWSLMYILRTHIYIYIYIYTIIIHIFLLPSYNIYIYVCMYTCIYSAQLGTYNPCDYGPSFPRSH